ncbi:putative membrane protein [Microvirga lupini]|uniref:Putative membrane protein n=1 Tax=Microvirga lupini TaxID=420324 RepID=A0A7W4YXM8_9HYPH|nr:hypothetical protein [Microvirga lupini]MBB3020675.1 putative membrane protein [Microvirga lupini]
MKRLVMPTLYLSTICSPAVAEDGTIWAGWLGAIGAVVSALIAAYVGSKSGAMHAVQGYKTQKAFDNQLDWYIRMLRSVRSLNERIRGALVWEAEGRGDPHWWSQVQIAHEEFERTAWEAPLFGTDKANAATKKCLAAVEAAAKVSEIFDPYHMKKEGRDPNIAFEAARALPPVLEECVKPIISEARIHLGIAVDAPAS